MTDITLDRAALLRSGGAFLATALALSESSCAKGHGGSNGGTTPSPTPGWIFCCSPGDFSYSNHPASDADKGAKKRSGKHPVPVPPQAINRIRLFLDDARLPSQVSDAGNLNEKTARYVYVIDSPYAWGHDETKGDHGNGHKPVANNQNGRTEKLWILIE